MSFRTEILKTGRNKFDVGDIVVGRGNTYIVSSVYNDFTYSMKHIDIPSCDMSVVSDKGFFALALKRIVIVEKIKKPIINPYTGEINLKYNPQYIQEDFYFTIRA